MNNKFIHLLIILTLTSCAHRKPTDAAPAQSAASYDESSPIIDAHTHTQFEGMYMPLALPTFKPEVFHEQLKRANVVAAVAHTVLGPHAYQDQRAFGVMHCGGVGKKVDAVEIDSGLKSGKYSCIKIYLGYTYRYAYDAAYEPLYRLAQKYDVPVVFHTGDTWDKKGLMKYADPMAVDEVAVKHPKVRFVIAHCGNPWIETAAEIIYKNDNVYGDVSAFMVGNMDEMPADKLEQYVIKPIRWIFGYVDNPKKLMFGSDWPLSDIAAYARAVRKAIPQEHWQAVFHDNALQVFTKLKPVKN